MHIAFRVDSSTVIGYGHVTRCLTLAHAFAQEFTQQQNSLSTKVERGCDEHLLISFFCRDHKGNINNQISKAGFKLLTLPRLAQILMSDQTATWLGTSFTQDAQACIKHIEHFPKIDLLIIDHYAIDHQWQKLLKPYYNKLLVIDDLANRKHICDVLLDQTFKRNKQEYTLLVPEYCHFLIGEQYILLRNEFAALKSKVRKRRNKYVNAIINIQANILVSMGGTDPNNLSQVALLAIEQLIAIFPDITATLVISSQSKHLSTLTSFSHQRPWINLMINSENMAGLMLNADIAIGACGGTAWERCCLGLPCLTTVNAKNQQVIADNLSYAGAIMNLGWYKNITVDNIYTATHYLLNNKKLYQKMSTAGINVCDGSGAKRVVSELITTISKTSHSSVSSIRFRKATSQDCQLIYSWQSNKNIRKHFIEPKTPTWEEHRQWYNHCMLDQNRRLYLLDNNLAQTIGLLRLDKLTKTGYSGEIYEISIIIAPESQGFGYAVKALQQLVTLTKTARYLATVATGNLPSHKAFSLAGFHKTSATTYQLNVENFQSVPVQVESTKRNKV